MRWHKATYLDETNVLRHPVDSEAWKEFDKNHTWFAQEPHNIRLGLTTDGFNPFGNMSTNYNMWHVILFPYNLPPWKCFTDPFMMMSLLIPGPQAPGKDIDVYLRPLVDELKELWSDGVETFDASTGECFKMHDAVLWTINDFPAYDVMHIEKNICESILGTLLNIDKKIKDTEKAREDLKDMNIRKELWLQHDDSSYTMPSACYNMSEKEKREFGEFLQCVKCPDGYASNISRCVSTDGVKLAKLKSHDYHVLLQRLLPIAIRGFGNKDVYLALIELGHFFQRLCCKTLKRDDLEQLERDIVIILCKLEMIFPHAFFYIMVHLAVHLPREAMYGGPVQYRWMYKIERFLCKLKRYVRNKARPEGSIVEGYIIDECLTF
ncbi:hypothetical protein MTR67_012701 [Solanum verrucosum]|uniref:DUF4218 domain-containing protein n=1 Tax=Solanum verrucosum TaxID=315347 RepID=A0AAF0QEZ2_SOLVR|nr:hypothetical protein MTR67_012701 [Solanum verrucosum]